MVFNNIVGRVRAGVENLVGAVDPNAVVSYQTPRRSNGELLEVTTFAEFQEWFSKAPDGHMLYVICMSYDGKERRLYMWREEGMLLGMQTEDMFRTDNPQWKTGITLLFLPDQHGEVVPRIHRLADQQADA